MRVSLILLLAGLAAGCSAAGASDDEEPAGRGASRNFQLAGFDRVTLAGPDNVSVKAGPGFSVRAEGEPEVLDKLDLKVVDGALVVDRLPHSGATVVNPFGGSDKGRARISVTMPTITGASLSGAGRFTVADASASSFTGAVGGAGSLDIDGLKTEEARFDLSGAGGLTVSGSARTAALNVSGAGAVKAEAFEVRDLKVEMSGVGSVRARATGRVTGSLSGVGRVAVSGTSDCAIERSGVGSVQCGL